MIKAEDARNVAENSISNKTQTQLKEIEKRIEKAMKDGEFKAYWYQELTIQSRDILKEHGYKLKDVGNQRDGTGWKIIW